MRGKIGSVMRAAGMRLNENGGPRRYRMDIGCCGARAVLAVLLVAAASAAVSAQESPVPEGLTMENVGSGGWVVAPDFKFTRVDDGDAALVGAYGGKFINRGLLLGGGAYWLSGAPHASMAYGGGLVEWFGNPGGLVDFSVRGFVGLGTATLSERFAYDDGCDNFGLFDVDGLTAADGGLPIGGAVASCGLDSMPALGGPGFGGSFYSAGEWGIRWPADPFEFGVRQNFLLAEPQASIHLNVAPWLRISGGAGYRLIGRGGDFTDRLRGLTANVGVQIGPR